MPSAWVQLPSVRVGLVDERSAGKKVIHSSETMIDRVRIRDAVGLGSAAVGPAWDRVSLVDERSGPARKIAIHLSETTLDRVRVRECLLQPPSVPRGTE